MARPNFLRILTDLSCSQKTFCTRQCGSFSESSLRSLCVFQKRLKHTQIRIPFVHTYAKLPIGGLLLDSCFTEAGFVLSLYARPEPSSPQADTVELTAKFLKLIPVSTGSHGVLPHPLPKQRSLAWHRSGKRLGCGRCAHDVGLVRRWPCGFGYLVAIQQMQPSCGNELLICHGAFNSHLCIGKNISPCTA